MSTWSRDGKLQHDDIRDQRIAAGTIGNDHYTPSSVGGNALNTIISPVDNRVTYGGDWSISVGSGADATDLLGFNTFSSFPGSNISLPFNGTSVSIIGKTYPHGGRADTYIDGQLAKGKVNTSDVLSAAYELTGGLNATDTSITGNDTSAFASSGSLLIDGEQIDYTSTSGGNTFTGCTRGANGTTAAIHNAGTTIYQLNNRIEFYSPRVQQRITVWSVNNLSFGPHTLELVLRSDKNASSDSTEMYLNGFIIGGVAGAYNLNTNIRYVDVSVTTDSNGFSGDVTIHPANTTEQFLGVLGVQKQGDLTTKIASQWNATTGKLVITGPALSTFTVTITCLFLGPSI